MRYPKALVIKTSKLFKEARETTFQIQIEAVVRTLAEIISLESSEEIASQIIVVLADAEAKTRHLSNTHNSACRLPIFEKLLRRKQLAVSLRLV